MFGILVMLFAGAFIQPVCAEEIPLPIMDCTVEYANGFFDAYSGAPDHGDTTVLDLKKLMAEKRHSQLTFKAVDKRRSTDYIIVECPLKVVKTKQTMEKKPQFWSCRLEGTDSAAAFNRSRFDIHVTGKESWIVYYTLEVDGVAEGVLVMSAKPHAVSKR